MPACRPGVLNLVYGVPAEISSYLIPHPVIRKITFTGSTPVGKQLAALAGPHMKRVTMELGGHAPVIVFDDADVDVAASALAFVKFRNAGQVCISPTRFLVQEGVYAEFVEQLRQARQGAEGRRRPGRGHQDGPAGQCARGSARWCSSSTTRVPKAPQVAPAASASARGNFFEPTVIDRLPLDAASMNEEPFGPLAVDPRFKTC